jgi:hypothetical protein
METSGERALHDGYRLDLDEVLRHRERLNAHEGACRESVAHRLGARRAIGLTQLRAVVDDVGRDLRDVGEVGADGGKGPRRRFAKTCRACAAKSPSPTMFPSASADTCPEM